MKITETAITFDDVLLVPAFSSVVPREVELNTSLTDTIDLNIPLLSAAMDTVTESKMAIALSQNGGLGVIHKNMTIERQAKEVRMVKRYKSGIVKDPLTVMPNTPIQEVLDLMETYKISGLPVVDGEKLVGIVTSRDTRFETRLSDPVSNIMTKQDKLVTVTENASEDHIKELLHNHRIEKLLVVNKAFQLCGLITLQDIQKAQEFPNACKDVYEQLRVGAAVGVGESSQDRVRALITAGADIIVVDTAHGHSTGVIETVQRIKSEFSDSQVIVGNIATTEAAKALVEAGADSVKVGIGPGSICTTRIVTGVGVPQITAIQNVAAGLKGSKVKLIADGGVRFSGDIGKALAAGADAVMIGSLLAGTEEAPGEIELYKGRSYKAYRGMGSIAAMAQKDGSADRYFQESDAITKLVPEGVEGRVPYKGSAEVILHQLLGGVRATMGYIGCKTISKMHKNQKFIRLTNAGMRESHVHNVMLTKEPPNYQIE